MAIRHVDRPRFSPTRCLVCWQNQHPDGFVDFGVDVPEHGYTEAGKMQLPPTGNVALEGHLYLCAGCVQTAADKVGCATPADRAKLEQQLADAQAQVTGQQAELERERQSKTVNLDDLRQLLADPAKPAPKHPRKHTDAKIGGSES